MGSIARLPVGPRWPVAEMIDEKRALRRVVKRLRRRVRELERMLMQAETGGLQPEDRNRLQVQLLRTALELTT